jgi:3-deoxy-manno-octulosonate cytidylyltransferase (CMP-KDO synthetase)
MESTRLPNKALKDICGLPMVIHTLKRTLMAQSLDRVYVVTDSEQIANLVEAQGGGVIMTDTGHETGSDRIAEAALKVDSDIIVNIQGDEALVLPDHIDKSVQGLRESSHNVSILLTEFNQIDSPSSIKAVVNKRGEVMYLSRADIPSNSRTKSPMMLKAYHVVSFRKDFLIKYSRMSKTRLEIIEFNEYLRILENGFGIQGVFVDSDSVSVDTAEDLEYVRGKMEKDAIFALYRDSVG